MKKFFLMVVLLSATSLLASDAKKAEYLNSIKDVIVTTQHIRDGTYNFHNGSEFAQFAIFEERSKQKRAYKQLDKQYRVAGKKLDGYFDKLRKQTRSLNKMAFQLEPITSFNAYTTLISKMITDSQIAQKDFFSKSSELVKSVSLVMASDLLLLEEAVAKSRGIGSGVIARTYCDDYETDMLEKYLEDVDKYLKSSISMMRSLSKKHAKQFPSNFNKKLTELQKETGQYVQFLRDKIVDQDEISEDPNKFFDDGSQIIADILELYKINFEILKK